MFFWKRLLCPVHSGQKAFIGDDEALWSRAMLIGIFQMLASHGGAKELGMMYCELFCGALPYPKSLARIGSLISYMLAVVVHLGDSMVQ